MSFFNKILEWVEKRISLSEVISFITTFGIFYYPFPLNKPVKEGLKDAIEKPVPYYSRWPYFLGIVIFLLFLFQCITGVLLLLHYIPSMEKGYESTMTIIRDIPLGYYVFNTHRWGGFLLIIFVLIRLFRFVYHKVYHPPRELFWVFAFALFILLSVQYTTGILLPMSNKSYWQVERVQEIIKIIPLVNFIYSFFLGNFIIDEFVHIRYYVFHAFFVPFLIFGIFYLHFLSVRKLGFLHPGKKSPIYPGYFFDIFIIILLLFGILVTLATLFPAKHVEIFDPFKTPQKISIPFFLLPFYFMKFRFPRVISGTMIILFFIFLFFLPWIDRSKPAPLYKKPIAGIIFVLLLAGLIAAGLLGFYQG